MGSNICFHANESRLQDDSMLTYVYNHDSFAFVNDAFVCNTEGQEITLWVIFSHSHTLVHETALIDI